MEQTQGRVKRFFRVTRKVWKDQFILIFVMTFYFSFGYMEGFCRWSFLRQLIGIVIGWSLGLGAILFAEIMRERSKTPEYKEFEAFIERLEKGEKV